MPSDHSVPSRQVLIALNACRELSRAAVCRLAQKIEAWHPPRRDPRPVARRLGLPLSTLLRAIRAVAEADLAVPREIESSRRLDARIITLGESAYPEPLLDLQLPPPVLYCRGEVPGGAAVAIVGSRRADPYGREASRFFARHLAAAGVVVVSGLARGIDAAAHGGALEAHHGRTVAVLGCGLDVPYPRGHESIADRITERGAVLSEFPFGTPPLPYHFPVRNRIIAALGNCTLVVQAAPRSGSLITARHALELGRDVFAVPGRIFDQRALGPNVLLRDGAQLALHPRDLLDGLPGAAAAPGSEGGNAAEAPPPSAPVRGFPGRLLCALVPGSPRSPERLAESLGAPLDQVLSALLDLELGGWAERHPGGAYTRRVAWGE